MNIKTKILTDKSVKYLREVSVVVIGVAITLTITLWASRKSEKRDMNLYLNAVKMELEENIKEIDDALEYLRIEANYADYLNYHDSQSINIDTLEYYGNTCCFTLNKFTFNTNAFEMLKNAGMMRFLKDKGLTLTLWNVYEMFKSIEFNLGWEADRKWAIMEKELNIVLTLSKAGKLESEELINNPFLSSYYIFNTFKSRIDQCNNTLNKVNETVEKLEKYSKK